MACHPPVLCNVLAAEAFNTAIERLVNLVSPDYHPIAGDVKDIAQEPY